MRKSQLVNLVKEVIKEMSTTGMVGGYQTPNAFSKDKKKNRATKFAEKIGYKKV